MYEITLRSNVHVYMYIPQSVGQMEGNEMEKKNRRSTYKVGKCKPRCLEKNIAWNEKLEIRMHMCYSL